MKNSSENLEDKKQLLDQYRSLLRELDRLKDENRKLKKQLGLLDIGDSPNPVPAASIADESSLEAEATGTISGPIISSASSSADKISLFMTLFKCREDVFAKRWENKRKGIAGYAPVCLNEWQAATCAKPKMPCSRCSHKSYAVLDNKIIENHLRGHIVVGVYPMFPDETCRFFGNRF
jgi:hypothetical protein